MTMYDQFLYIEDFDPSQFEFTRWADRRSSYGGVTYVGIDTLVTHLDSCAGEVAAKENLPMYAFVSTIDGHRCGASVHNIYGMGFDCDSGESAEAMFTYLNDREIAYVYYETWSHRYACEHNPDGKPAWRIVVFFTEPFTSEEAGADAGFQTYKAIWTFTGTGLWEIVGYDISSFDRIPQDASRGWHPGARPESSITPRRVIYHPGRGIDAQAMLARIPPEMLCPRTPSTVTAGRECPCAPLEDDELETLVCELVDHWRLLAGRRVRHNASMALLHSLVLGGCMPEEAVLVIREVALRAGDVDEIEYGNRSSTAEWAAQDEYGYRLRWLRQNAPELHDALMDSEVLDFGIDPGLRADLEEDDE